MRCCCFASAISTKCFSKTRKPARSSLTLRSPNAANAYIGRLLRAGRKIAICDQMEEARPGQLVKREVTQIFSHGTHFDERMISAERNNFLAAVYSNSGGFGLALADVTTGDFLTTEVENESALLTELQRLRPAEIIYPSESENLKQL